jgi:hypothetical protein
MIDLRNGKDYVEFCSFVGRWSLVS